MSDQFNPDALRKEFADYCDEVAPGIKARAPRLNQMETLSLIGMTLFQACKDLKAERSQLVDEISGLRSARIAYASEFPPNADGEPDVGNIHANIRAMKATVTAIRRAISDYHFALDSREHGGIAQNMAFNSICKELDMYWTQGAEAERRAAKENQ